MVSCVSFSWKTLEGGLFLEQLTSVSHWCQGCPRGLRITGHDTKIIPQNNLFTVYLQLEDLLKYFMVTQSVMVLKHILLLFVGLIIILMVLDMFLFRILLAMLFVQILVYIHLSFFPLFGYLELNTNIRIPEEPKY